MIPGSNVFANLKCGFGRKCGRPYCTYSHNNIEDEDEEPEQTKEQQTEVESASSNSQEQYFEKPSTSYSGHQIEQQQEEQNQSIDSQNYHAYQAFMDTSQQSNHSPIPINDYPVFEPYEISGEEEVQGGGYNGYMAQDYEQYEPVEAEYVPRPVGKAKIVGNGVDKAKGVEKPRHHGYSALDDKPKIPVDLGKDDILMDLIGNSSKQKQQQQANSSSAKSQPNTSKKAPLKSQKLTSRNRIEIPKRKIQQGQEKPNSSQIKRQRKLDDEIIVTAEIRNTSKQAHDAQLTQRLNAALFGDDDDEIVPPKKATVPQKSSSQKETLDQIVNRSVAALSQKISQSVERPGVPPSKERKGVAIAAINANSSNSTGKGPQRLSAHSQMMSRFNAANGEKKQGSATADGKVDGKRKAHAPPPQPLVPLDKFNTKIPYNQRHRSLEKLYEEFCKHDDVDSVQALEMSRREEKLLFDRAQTSTGYAASLAGAVRGIRNRQFTLPEMDSQGSVAKVVSITETMEKERKSDKNPLAEHQFYKILREKYLMTPQQLKDNGYPFVYKDENGTNRVGIECGDKKMFTENEDLKRFCCRCGTEYQLKPNGSFLNQQDCIFHWKRAFKKRINRMLESRYGCCDADSSVKGCIVHPMHVHQTMRRSALKEFIRTPQASGPEDSRSKKVYAMDCEMVYTTWGISLARVTVVDWEDKMVLDLLVKPTEKILDCNTKFSGLTEDMLNKADCDLDKARRKLFELVNTDTILIGHSLESDLRALRLVHRRVIDTSVVFPHRLGPPMKRALRNLASDYLQKIIQEDVEGHDSKEDSSTCLQLMLMKAKGEI